MKYIAYGSNMNTQQMAYRCPGAQLIGTGLLQGFKLEFNRHATIIQTKSSTVSVPVAVWEISPVDEQRLDLYEGYPHYYKKTIITVDMGNGELLIGMVYLMRTFDFFPPGKEYFKGIRDAYAALGLSSEIKRVLQPALMRSYRLTKW